MKFTNQLFTGTWFRNRARNTAGERPSASASSSSLSSLVLAKGSSAYGWTMPTTCTCFWGAGVWRWFFRGYNFSGFRHFNLQKDPKIKLSSFAISQVIKCEMLCLCIATRLVMSQTPKHSKPRSQSPETRCFQIRCFLQPKCGVFDGCFKFFFIVS